MKNIVVIGALGMAGHIITDQLIKTEKYKVTGIARNPGPNVDHIIDVSDFQTLKEVLIKTSPDYVINCVGVLVQGSENNLCNAINLNSYLPNFLSDLGRELNYKLLHISTDCVFSGNQGQYSESSYRDGDTNYARTKTLGEINNEFDLTIRTSIIGPELKENGTGLMHWFLNQKESINGYSNAFWSGVTTIELAKYIVETLDSDITGLIHLCPEGKVSKYELLSIMNDVFNKNIEISPFDDYHCDKSLVSTRKEQTFIPLGYKEMIIETEKWIKSKKYYSYI